jgi:hypothetical protein
MSVVNDRAKALRPVIQAALAEGGIDAICELIARLEARIEELEKRLGKNSSNSIKPPFSDGLKRTKSQRPKNSGRRSGGQPGPNRNSAETRPPDPGIPPLRNRPPLRSAGAVPLIGFQHRCLSLTDNRRPGEGWHRHRGSAKMTRRSEQRIALHKIPLPDRNLRP